MSNPPPPASSPDTPKWTRHPAHTTSSTARRSGASERLRIVRNLLIALENNRAASENNLRAGENTVRAAENGIQAADRQSMEAAKEVVRVVRRRTDRGRRGPSLLRPTLLVPKKICTKMNLRLRVRSNPTTCRFLCPNRAGFAIRSAGSRLERLVLVVSVAGITAFFMVVMPPGTVVSGNDQRTADTNSPDSQSPAQPAGSATTPTASAGPPRRPSTKRPLRPPRSARLIITRSSCSWSVARNS